MPHAVAGYTRQQSSAAPAHCADATRADTDLLGDVRLGDEAAFVCLVERYSAALLRLALTYVHDRAIAEEVVQDTWIGVLKSIDAFEERASLKTWIFRILVNRASTSAQREGRSIPFSSVFEDDDEPSVPAECFNATDSGQRLKGWWATPPTAWGAAPEQQALAGELRARVTAAITDLPPTQRQVITLRDMEGCSSDEVCALLAISEGNQRVLLHRARSKVRMALNRYFRQE